MEIGRSCSVGLLVLTTAIQIAGPFRSAQHDNAAIEMQRQSVGRCKAVSQSCHDMNAAMHVNHGMPELGRLIHMRIAIRMRRCGCPKRSPRPANRQRSQPADLTNAIARVVLLSSPGKGLQNKSTASASMQLWRLSSYGG